MKLPAAGELGAETVTTRYDALSRAEWMAGGLGWGVYVADTVYDVTGETLRHDLGNTYAFFVNYQYQEGTRRLEKTWVEREGVAGIDMDLTYAYDATGNPTSIVDRPTGKPVDAQCFAYDGLRQLTSAWTPASADCGATRSVSALGGPAPYWKDYVLDAAGNRSSETVHASGGDTTWAYSYPAVGAARPHGVTNVTRSGAQGAATSTYAYDAVGSTTTRAIAGGTAQTLAWDAEGRLESVKQGSATVMSALYTADGERLIRRQGGVTTVYLPGGQEVRLTTSTGAVSSTRYYSFNGQVVAMRTGKSGSTVSSMVADPHQTATMAIANTTKAITQRRTDPYGNARGAAAGAWPGDRGFLDKVLDSTGLTQVGARYYDASIGRFVSVDPVMDLASPQQWAAYSYADNNPVAKWDPTGLIPMIDGKWGSRASAKAARNQRSMNPFRLYGNYVKGILEATVGAAYAGSPVGQIQAAVNRPGGVLGPFRSGRQTWSQIHSWSDYANTLGATWSNSWRPAWNSVKKPWIDGDPYGKAEQVGNVVRIIGMSAIPFGGVGSRAAGATTRAAGVRSGAAAEASIGATSSAVRVGPGAALENISTREALRIQNAANRIGEPISLVGSRASGTAGAYSDWDYVISGINSSTRHSVSSSLPRGATELGVGRQIDIFRGPLNEAAPYITFFPGGG